MIMGGCEVGAASEVTAGSRESLESGWGRPLSVFSFQGPSRRGGEDRTVPPATVLGGFLGSGVNAEVTKKWGAVPLGGAPSAASLSL